MEEEQNLKTPWSKSTTPAYTKQEARISKKAGARAQVNSGRTWKARGDAVEMVRQIAPILTDCKGPKEEGKETSYTLTPKKWRQLRKMANSTPPGCVPSFQLDLAPDVRLRVIDDSLFEIMRSRINADL